jgi:hypothetical protein
MPLSAAGQRIEPSVSVPTAIGAALSADGAPAAGGTLTSKVCPFGEVGLADDDGAGIPELLDDHGVLGGLGHGERKRARSGALAARSIDVVLHENRDSVQRAPHLALSPLLVHPVGDLDSVRAERQHRAQLGTDPVRFSDTAKQSLN